MVEYLELNGLTFTIEEVHRKAPKSWDRGRKRHKFDGFDLRLPGTFLWNGYQTREEAVAEAERMAFGYISDPHLVREANALAIQKLC